MSTDADRNDKALQYSVEEYKQVWDFVRVLHQDRRHVWTFLTTVLLGLPVAAAALAGKEELAKLVGTYRHAVVSFLIVLWVVGLLGFIHLIFLRQQLVEYLRELNRIRGFWRKRGVELPHPPKQLQISDDRPRFWQPAGANIWFAAPIALIVSFVFSLACLVWTRAYGNWWVIPCFSLLSLLGLILFYRGSMVAMCREYGDWRRAAKCTEKHSGSIWPRFPVWSLVGIFILAVLAGSIASALFLRTPDLPRQEQQETTEAATPLRHHQGHARDPKRRTHHRGHFPAEHGR